MFTPQTTQLLLSWLFLFCYLVADARARSIVAAVYLHDFIFFELY